MKSNAFLFFVICYSSTTFAGFNLDDLKNAANKIDKAIQPKPLEQAQESNNDGNQQTDGSLNSADSTSNNLTFCISDNVCLGSKLQNIQVNWVSSNESPQAKSGINEKKLSYAMSAFPYQGSEKYVGLYGIFSDELYNSKIYINKKYANELISLNPVCRFITAEGAYLDDKGNKIVVRFNPLTKDHIKFDWVITSISADFSAKTEAGKNIIIQKYEGSYGELLEPMEIDSGRATMIHEGVMEPVGYGVASKQKNRESVTIRMGDVAGFGEPYWNGMKRLPSFASYNLDENFIENYKQAASCKKPDENAEQAYMKAMSVLGK